MKSNVKIAAVLCRKGSTRKGDNESLSSLLATSNWAVRSARQHGGGEGFLARPAFLRVMGRKFGYLHRAALASSQVPFCDGRMGEKGGGGGEKREDIFVSIPTSKKKGEGEKKTQCNCGWLRKQKRERKKLNY